MGGIDMKKKIFSYEEIRKIVCAACAGGMESDVVRNAIEVLECNDEGMILDKIDELSDTARKRLYSLIKKAVEEMNNSDDYNMRIFDEFIK